MQIANFVRLRVTDLAMVIDHETVHTILYYERELEHTGKAYEERKYRKWLIKLTKNPTDDDKQKVGFHSGIADIDIKQNLSE